MQGKSVGRTIHLLTATLLVFASPAQAEDFGEDGLLSYWFHQYGSDDVNRPPLTPDRPYWHGDDAVPPAMRWHDRQIEEIDEYGVTIGPRLPPPAAAILAAETVVIPAPAPLRRHVRRRRATRVAVAPRSLCPPSPPVVLVAPATLPPPLPPVPAPTEH